MKNIEKLRSHRNELLAKLKRDVKLAKESVRVFRCEHVVMLLDHSYSMNGKCADGKSKLEALAVATKEYLQLCDNNTSKVDVLSFAMDVQELPVGDILSSRWVFTARASTKIHKGLMCALEKFDLKDLDSCKRVILMSDGQPTDKSPMEIIKYVGEVYIPRKIVIDTVAFGIGADRAFLRQLALMTGGKFYVPSVDTAGLVRTFKALETKVRGLLKEK